MKQKRSDQGLVQFGHLTAAYKQNPSVEIYMQLRRENPHLDIDISSREVMYPLSSIRAELEMHGFNLALIETVRGADQNAISELSLQLLERLVKRKALKKKGETQTQRRGSVVPDKVVDYLVIMILDSLSRNGTFEINRDFIVLLKERLGGTNLHFDKAARAKDRRIGALWIAAKEVARGRKPPSFREIGRMMGVEASTVARWFSNGEYIKEANRLAQFFDEEGNLQDSHSFEAALREI